MRRKMIPILLLLAIAVFSWSQRLTSVHAPMAHAPTATVATAAPSHDALPPEVADTLALIRHRGPFPHRQDGVVFENRERELPMQPRGYYHEYTVDTPGAHDRGARRIITGGDPPVVYQVVEEQPGSAIHGRIARESNTQVFDSAEPSPGMYRTRRVEKGQDCPFSTTRYSYTNDHYRSFRTLEPTR